MDVMIPSERPEVIDVTEESTDLLAVLGTCVGRMLDREMSRKDVLLALFPDEPESLPETPVAGFGRRSIQALIDMGMDAARVDHFVEYLLRDAT